VEGKMSKERLKKPRTVDEIPAQMAKEKAAEFYCSHDLKELIDQLPPELQGEVKEFAEFLLEKRAKKFGRRLSQDWAGALREYREQYTSLELQKKESS
jgi:NTP pyrophosphatase (non-canonical NTP hydrolase)